MSYVDFDDVVDLTVDEPEMKKQKTALGTAPSLQQPIAKPPKPVKVPKVGKKDLPHVLIWVCAAGKGRGRAWSQKALKIIGVYNTKAEAEAEEKKLKLMEQYMQCGHGDILVGDSWEDEIDLVVRSAGECTL